MFKKLILLLLASVGIGSLQAASGKPGKLDMSKFASINPFGMGGQGSSKPTPAVSSTEVTENSDASASTNPTNTAPLSLGTKAPEAPRVSSNNLSLLTDARPKQAPRRLPARRARTTQAKTTDDLQSKAAPLTDPAATLASQSLPAGLTLADLTSHDDTAVAPTENQAPGTKSVTQNSATLYYTTINNKQNWGNANFSSAQDQKNQESDDDLDVAPLFKQKKDPITLSQDCAQTLAQWQNVHAQGQELLSQSPAPEVSTIETDVPTSVNMEAKTAPSAPADFDKFDDLDFEAFVEKKPGNASCSDHGDWEIHPLNDLPPLSESTPAPSRSFEQAQGAVLTSDGTHDPLDLDASDVPSDDVRLDGPSITKKSAEHNSSIPSAAPAYNPNDQTTHAYYPHGPNRPAVSPEARFNQPSAATPQGFSRDPLSQSVRNNPRPEAAKKSTAPASTTNTAPQTTTPAPAPVQSGFGKQKVAGLAAILMGGFGTGKLAIPELKKAHRVVMAEAEKAKVTLTWPAYLKAMAAYFKADIKDKKNRKKYGVIGATTLAFFAGLGLMATAP